MFERVEPVHVAGKDLHGRDERRHPHGHGEHGPHAGGTIAAQQMQGADGADRERGREIGGQHHVHEAIGEGRIEDRLEPVGGDELALRVDGIACRRLHPAVDRENPEGGRKRAERDHQGREEMEAGPDPLPTEQDDAEKARLEEEGGQHLVAHQGPEDGTGLVGKDAPVRAELVAHHHTRNDAHAEGDGEDALPVVEQLQVDAVAGPQRQEIQRRQIARQPDRKSGVDNVEADREGELESGEIDRAEILHAGFPCCVALKLERQRPVARSGAVRRDVARKLPDGRLPA